MSIFVPPELLRDTLDLGFDLESDFVLHNCHFAVQIDRGIGDMLHGILAGFSGIRGIGIQSNLRTVVEPGRMVPHVFPSTLQPRGLILVKGIARSRAMVAWLREQISWNPVKPDYRRDVAITTLSLHGPDVPVAEWQLVFRNAYPTIWEHDDLQAMENNVVFESITLQYECLDVERSIFDGLPGAIMDLIT